MGFPYLTGFSASSAPLSPACEFSFAAADEKSGRTIILSGPVDSGKSSVLAALHSEFSHLLNGVPTPREESERLEGLISVSRTNLQRADATKEAIALYERNLAQWMEALDVLHRNPIAKLGGVRLPDLRARLQAKTCLYCYIGPKRPLQFDPVQGPGRIENVHQRQVENLARHFQQFLINRRTEQAYAHEDGDVKAATAIETWFDSLQNVFRLLFNDAQLVLEFTRRDFKVHFVFGDGAKIELTQLTPTRAAVVSIFAEILIRLDHLRADNPSYDGEGFVLIESLETGLMPETLAMLLPLLTGLFPRLQFIVSTDQPTALGAARGAVLCELSAPRGLVLKSGLRQVATNKLSRFQSLAAQAPGTPSENAEIAALVRDLEDVSQAVVDEVTKTMKKVD